MLWYISDRENCFKPGHSKDYTHPDNHTLLVEDLVLFMDGAIGRNRSVH